MQFIAFSSGDSMRTSSVEQLILSLLSEQQGHLSSPQVFEALRISLPALNMSTIYRALERLAAAGKVSISDMGTGTLVYELAMPARHHHLVCQQCGKETILDDDTVSSFFTRVQNDYGFKVSTNHLILFGVCRQCQSNPS